MDVGRWKVEEKMMDKCCQRIVLLEASMSIIQSRRREAPDRKASELNRE